MTKEEYKRNLIRMFDSLRDEHKGEENCIGVACGDCPLYNKQPCGPLSAFEAIEFAENWAKENQIKTNADKFKEMFGVDAPMNRCITNDVFCADCEYYEFGYEHNGCKVDERFWEAEYKPTKGGEKNVV